MRRRIAITGDRTDRSEDPCWDIDLDEAGKEATKYQVTSCIKELINRLHQDLEELLTFAQVPKNHVHVQPYDVLLDRICLNKTKKDP